MSAFNDIIFIYFFAYVKQLIIYILKFLNTKYQSMIIILKTNLLNY